MSKQITKANGHDAIEVQLSDPEYLRDLADRLMRIPVMYGTDQGDCSRLIEMAKALEQNEG